VAKIEPRRRRLRLGHGMCHMQASISDTAALHAIVLAAGASTRFGSPKQLARVGGRPLLQIAVERAVEVIGRAVTVVLGAHAAEIVPVLRNSPASIVINRNWNEGQASSVRAGVAQLPGSCAGVLLLLADQAAVSSADLARLADAWGRQPEYIVAAQYAGTVGAPTIFPRASFAALMQLRGDHGAQALLRSNPDRVVRVPLARAATDIDTPHDLMALTAPGMDPDS
jgi:molybdenum cofactor cytidylyltransferase